VDAGRRSRLNTSGRRAGKLPSRRCCLTIAQSCRTWRGQAAISACARAGQPVCSCLLEKGGPAESGGLLVGDILARLNGQSLKDADDLFSALHGDIVGKKVAVDVLRGGQPQTLQVTPAERK
jgi:predicted metalloprotease with PDZ domain